MSEGVLDTSTFLAVGRVEAGDLPTTPLLTAVTLGELGVGPLVATDESVRAERQAHLQLAEAEFDPLPFDAAAARSFARIAAGLRRAGRKPSARSLDAMIAATAASRGLAVHTSNPGDFRGMDGVEVVEVRFTR